MSVYSSWLHCSAILAFHDDLSGVGVAKLSWTRCIDPRRLTIFAGGSAAILARFAFDPVARVAIKRILREGLWDAVSGLRAPDVQDPAQLLLYLGVGRVVGEIR